MRNTFQNEATEMNHLFDHLKKITIKVLNDFDFNLLFLQILKQESQNNYKLAILRLLLCIFRYSRDLLEKTHKEKIIPIV